MKSKLFSRKLILTVACTALTVFNEKLGLGLSTESIMTVAGIVVAYVASQGYVDGKEKEL